MVLILIFDIALGIIQFFHSSTNTSKRISVLKIPASFMISKAFAIHLNISKCIDDTERKLKIIICISQEVISLTSI